MSADQRELEKFIQVLINFYNNCSQWSNRGWSPSQMMNHPNVQTLLAGQKSLPQELKKLIENAQIDPLDVLTWVNVSDVFSKVATIKITEQVLKLDIPTLDEADY